MAFYLVERTDATNYDEYDAVVVRASGRKIALNIVIAQDEDGPAYAGFAPDGSNARVTRLTDVKSDGPSAILSSYLAG